MLRKSGYSLQVSLSPGGGAAAPTITQGGIVPVYSSAPVIQPASWASIYGSLGYVFGSNLPLLEMWVKRAGITLTIVAVIVVAYLLYLRKKRKRAKQLSEQTPV